MSKKLHFLASFLAFFAFLSGAFAQTITFSDVKEDSIYFKEVTYLAEKKIIQGYPDGTYLPKSKINRAELTKLMVAMQGIQPDPQVYKNCFTDVKTQWFAPYVCYAKEKKWIQGYEDGNFKPANYVTAAESLKIILNPLFADAIAKQTPQEIEVAIKDFYDVEKTDWFAPYVAFAKQKVIIFEGSGISYGKGDSFGLYSPNRGIIAQLIFRALLLSENDWAMYSDYYADKVLKAAGFTNLIASSSGCYSLDGVDFSFYSNYLQSKYGLQKPYQSPDVLGDLQDLNDSEYLDDPEYVEYIKLFKEEISFPLLDSGYFCDLGENGYLFSNKIALSEQDLKGHLIFFDKNGAFLSDKVADCSEWVTFAYTAVDPAQLQGAELKNLEWVNCLYLKDGKSVYFFEGDKIEGADASSFQTLRLPYSKDAKQAYYLDELIEEANGATFETFEDEKIDENHEEGIVHYAKDADHVFYDGKRIEGADAKTFKILENGYAQDATRIFFNGVMMKQYDAPTFEVMDEHYAKDKNGVYYNYGIMGKGEFLELKVIQLIGARPETLQILEGDYAVDGDKVYYQGGLMSNADGATFQTHESYYSGVFATDKNYSFERSRVATWFDPETMEIVDGLFIKQEGEMYYNFGYEINPMSSESELLDAQDFTDFTVLENAPIFPGSWARGGSKIYLMYVHLIEVLDAPTFEFINKVYSKDSKNVFHLDQSGGGWKFFDIKGADPATFTPLTADDSKYSHFGKDAKHIYYKLQTLETGNLEVSTAKLDEAKGIIQDAKGYTCTIDLSTNQRLTCG